MVKRVIVVPHDPGWEAAFERLAKVAAPAFGTNLRRIHHIGSTAIPGIYAKPVIDMLAVVSDIRGVDQCNVALEALGYVAKGEFGIPGRRYFYSNDSGGVRTHQIHTFQEGTANVARHLAFRDFLRAHPAVALEYSELKRRLAKAYPEDIEAYMDGKDAFIKEMEQKAVVWVSAGGL